MTQDHALRRWREEKGVTLAVLALEVGVTPSHISEIERGLNTPSLDLAAKLSDATKDESGAPAVPIEEFVRRPGAEVAPDPEPAGAAPSH